MSEPKQRFKVQIINNPDNSQTHNYYDEDNNLISSNINLPEVTVTANKPSAVNNFIEDIKYNLNPSNYRFKDLSDPKTQQELSSLALGFGIPLAAGVAPIFAPGTVGGSLLGAAAGGTAVGMVLEEVQRAIGGKSVGDMISGELQNIGVPQIVADFVRPEYLVDPLHVGLAGKSMLNTAGRVVENGLHKMVRPMLVSKAIDRMSLLTNNKSLKQPYTHIRHIFPNINSKRFPIMYRKTSHLPELIDDNVDLTSNRIRMQNGSTPINITNMTSDVPVRSHSKGNWDSKDVYAFPGNVLKDKNVISTRPSDTFIVNELLHTPKAQTILISGNPRSLQYAADTGIPFYTNSRLQELYNPELIHRTGTFNDKLYRPDNSAYSREIENITRELFPSPTIKQYREMDKILKPEYTSNVFKKFNLNDMTDNRLPLLELGNSSVNRYMNPEYWSKSKIIYAPASRIESEWRDLHNISDQEYDVVINTLLNRSN